jgi:tRNA(Ile)-lysidine synthase
MRHHAEVTFGPGDAAVHPVLAGLVDRCTFPPTGTAVRVGVSGGADSLALLSLAVTANLDVTAVHVDHQLRADSGADRDVVRRAAHQLGVTVEVCSVRVVPGPNVEARARAARHEVLGPGALFGHTADDQAETLVLALLRGSGLDGLSAMDPATHPILGLRRSDTEAVCTALGWKPVIDPTNSDVALRRNAIRHRVLPLLAEVAERDVADVIARTSAVLRADRLLLDDLASSIDPTSCAALLAAPRALASRAVRTWLSDPYPPDVDALDRVWQVVSGERVACEISGGVRVARRAGRLRIERQGTAAQVD